MALMDYTPIGAVSNWAFQNPANKASGYLDQIPETLRPYFEPYIKAGQGTIPTLQGQYNNLLNNPGELYQKLASGYQSSPGYDFAKKQALGAIDNAAAAGGSLGSMGHQQQAGEMATNLANKDFNDYLNQILGLYGSGLSGTQDMFKTGFGASTNFGEDLAQALMSQGNLAYAGQQNQNNFRGGLLQSLAGLAGGFF